ncbi:MAG TPA: hypothetical protein VD902_09395 [Symbiobacteriaceae bacterium]|nr:hypothetical protein [Symbiobacteriaceae bacterium]
MPRVIVTIKEPVYDPQAYGRAMKVLEEHCLEIMLKRARGLTHVQETEPEGHEK